MRNALVGAAALALIAAPGAALAAAEDFVVVEAGGLPVILTAPHGGTSMAGLPTRNRGVMLHDEHTLEITLRVAARLEKLLGARPYVVAAKFSRRAIDANRAPGEAFDYDGARPVYEAYHGAIARFIADIRRRFPGGGMLLDIHGQSTERAAIFRGTRNGATVRRLLERSGLAAFTGPQSILGALQAKGYAIIPPNTPPGSPREDRQYGGGYTTQIYSGPDGIDAMQLELGADLRTRPALADDLADAIAVFVRAYLPVSPG
jgi:N-formylglutamate amidohydrolase